MCVYIYIYIYIFIIIIIIIVVIFSKLNIELFGCGRVSPSPALPLEPVPCGRLGGLPRVGRKKRRPMTMTMTMTMSIFTATTTTTTTKPRASPALRGVDFG